LPTTYDAAHCYISSSMVCRSVGLSVTVVSPAKTAEPIKMPFGLRRSAMSWAKTAEAIEMLFGIWTQVGPKKHVPCGVHTGTTW